MLQSKLCLRVAFHYNGVVALNRIGLRALLRDW